MAETGTLYIVSAPSGAGKTTLVKALVEAVPNITVSISHTTRPKRPLEEHGFNYYFIDKTTFQQMIDRHEFLEHAIVFDHFYGTSHTWVKDTLQQGKDVILEIDWQGCQQIQKLFPDCISIFILPPSLKELSERLIQRNQDKPEIIKQRVNDARETIRHIVDFDYIVVNDDFQVALNDIKSIVHATRLQNARQMQKWAPLIADLQKMA